MKNLDKKSIILLARLEHRRNFRHAEFGGQIEI